MRVLVPSNLISLANEISLHSNCIRRSVGAVLVRNGGILAKGHNGVPKEYKDCREAGCPRCISGGQTGSGYENCICTHAEQSAIASAANIGISTANSVLYVNLRPCIQCLEIAKAAGVREIYFSGDEWTYPEDLEKIYLRLAAQLDSFRRVS